MHTHRNTRHVVYVCIPRVYTEDVMYNACIIGRVLEVSVCISGVVCVSVLNEALKRAASYGHTDIVTLLLSAGADIHYLDDYGLRYACLYSHIETVSTLIAAGAYVNAGGGLPITYASSAGCYDTTALLLASGSVIPRNTFQDIVYRGLTRIATLFISAGCDIHVNGELALITAVARGHTDIITALLAAHADVSTALETVESPAWQVAYAGHRANWSQPVITDRLRKLL